MSEDALLEVEALQSIYPNEFEMVTQSPLVYKVHLEPNPGAPASENHVGVALVCSIPDSYPDVIPELEVEVEKGLVKQQRQELMDLVARMAEENIGMPMVFTLCEGIKEWLLENNEEAQDDSMHAQMMRRQQQKEKEKQSAEKAKVAQENANRAKNGDQEDQKRREGTLVTPESFAGWKARFDAEMAALAEADGTAAAAIDMSKPSGKQLFLSNMAGEEVGVGAGEGEGEEQGVEVREDLFDEDEDLDDLDDEDYEDYEDEGDEDDDDYDGEEKS